MGGDKGWKTLTKASEKPRKISEKFQKKFQVAVFDLFFAEVAVFGMFSATQVTFNGLKSVT